MHDADGLDASRSDWIAGVRSTVQGVLPVARRSTGLWTLLATTVHQIDPPRTAMERLFVTHALERLAWTLLSESVAVGHASHAEAHAQYADIMRVLDLDAVWAELPGLLLSRTPERHDRTLAERVLEYVDRHAGEPLTLRHIARGLGVSVKRLTEEFRARYGTTVHDYLTVRRLDEAVRLLIVTDLKVAAIAARVGFRDQTALYRQLSQRTQYTPGEIRAQSRQLSAVHPAPL